MILNNQVNAANEISTERKTAESVFAFANELETFDAEAFKAELIGLSSAEKVKLVEMSIKDAKSAELSGGSGNPSIGLYILAVIFPPLAVGIYTDWGRPTLYNFLWTLLAYVPGVIHAFIVLSR